MNPKVLVGCPTWEGKEYCLEAYAAALQALDYDNFDILLVDNSPTGAYAQRIEHLGLPVEHVAWTPGVKERIVRSRNLLRQRALEGKYDYLLSIEQDVLVPADTITRLVGHRLDYVTTPVMNMFLVDGKHIPLPMLSVDFEGRPGKLRYIRAAELKEPLITVKQAHLSCTLLSRRILERFPFRYEADAYDDTCLCEDLLAAGFVLWCDTTLQIAHRPGNGPEQLIRQGHE